MIEITTNSSINVNARRSFCNRQDNRNMSVCPPTPKRGRIPDTFHHDPQLRRGPKQRHAHSPLPVCQPEPPVWQANTRMRTCNNSSPRTDWIATRYVCQIENGNQPGLLKHRRFGGTMILAPRRFLFRLHAHSARTQVDSRLDATQSINRYSLPLIFFALFSYRRVAGVLVALL